MAEEEKKERNETEWKNDFRCRREHAIPDYTLFFLFLQHQVGFGAKKGVETPLCI